MKALVKLSRMFIYAIYLLTMVAIASMATTVVVAFGEFLLLIFVSTVIGFFFAHAQIWLSNQIESAKPKDLLGGNLE